MTNFNKHTLNNAYKEALMYCLKNSIDRSFLFNNVTKEPSQLLHGTIASIYPQIFLEEYILLSFFLNFAKTYDEFNGYISAFIKSTEEYQRLASLYDDYVTLISELIKENSDEIFDVAIYYITLLYKGIFSCNGTFDYYKLKTDYDHRINMYGTRIASGFSTCRHMAINLKDIYEKLGYDACYISCGKKIDSSRSNKSIKFNHAMVGVTNGRKSLLVDPTWKTIGRFDYQKKEIASLKHLSDLKEPAIYFSIDHKGTCGISKDNYFNYLKFLEHNNYFNNNLDGLTQRNDNISSKVKQNLLYYIEWNAKHHDLFKEIAELEKLLSCYKEQDVVRTRR